jgi:hypothetical protein
VHEDQRNNEEQENIMYSSTPPGGLATLVLAAFTIVGCAPLKVSSDVERDVDMTRYHTYSWDSTDLLPTGDPRLDNNPFFHRRVQADVEKELATRGFEKATSGTPELLIHYHASVYQKIDVNSADEQRGYCGGYKPYVYEVGTLVLDLVDARTKRVVWRGSAQGMVEGIIDNQDWMEQKIDQAVTQLLATLPPRL